MHPEWIILSNTYFPLSCSKFWKIFKLLRMYCILTVCPGLLDNATSTGEKTHPKVSEHLECGQGSNPTHSKNTGRVPSDSGRWEACRGRTILNNNIRIVIWPTFLFLGHPHGLVEEAEPYWWEPQWCAWPLTENLHIVAVQPVSLPCQTASKGLYVQDGGALYKKYCSWRNCTM